MINAALFGAIVSIASQFSNGSAVSSQGCVSAITGSQSTVVAASVGFQHNPTAQTPKQGEVFMLAIEVGAFPQPCATFLGFRPGFKLPPGVTYVPTGASSTSPRPECFVGRINQTLTRNINDCPLGPTEVLADGTLMFDKRSGIWSIPDQNVLVLRIPVMSTRELGGFTATQTRGYVDFAAPDGFLRPPLQPQVSTRVYFNRPSITYPAPSSRDIGPYSATVDAFVDPHFNAGTITVELSRAGGAFEVVDTGTHDGSLFELDINSALTDLDANTDYQWRAKYRVTSNTEVVTGATQSFRTLPPPRFAYTPSIVGQGRITTSPAVNGDGTFTDRSVVTLTAVPDAGHRLVSFVVDGTTVAGASHTVTIAAPLTATATFELIPPEPEPEPEPGEGEGEGEGEPQPEPEPEPEPAEGEGEPQPEPEPAEGEGEPQPEPEPAEGEGEGEPDDDDDDDNNDNNADDDDDENDGTTTDGGCAAAGGAPVLAVGLVLLRRRRR